MALVNDSIGSQVIRVQRVFAEAWKRDMTAVSEKVQQMCPAWADHQETLLECDEICRSLLSNTDNYKKIGPLCGELKSMLKNMKELQKDSCGPIVVFLKNAMSEGMRHGKPPSRPMTPFRATAAIMATLTSDTLTNSPAA